tara:strand:- start:48 stop:569 length:522 start_codon:yes stop_codon:yes gene_type:complete
MADAASISVTATILPDEIQKILDAATTTVTPADTSEKWFYGLVNVTNSSADLISGTFLQLSTGTATASSPPAIAATDNIRFLLIKNTGTTDGSSATTEAIALSLGDADGSVAAASYNNPHSIEIGPGEVWYAKIPNTPAGSLHAISIDSNMAGSGSAGEGDVQCLVAAIIHDE